MSPNLPDYLPLICQHNSNQSLNVHVHLSLLFSMSHAPIYQFLTQFRNPTYICICWIFERSDFNVFHNLSINPLNRYIYIDHIYFKYFLYIMHHSIYKVSLIYRQHMIIFIAFLLKVIFQEFPTILQFNLNILYP
jgi:hypothetical protein